MKKTVGIGYQDFSMLREQNLFYIDKTDFIREWWENRDQVTLITRPRRFGKTLTMSMTEQFFSVDYAGRSDLFEGLSIWEKEEYRKLQGTYPVISLSFANVKENKWEIVRRKINEILMDLYNKNIFLKESGKLTEKEKEFFDRVSPDMDESTASLTLHRLSEYLYRYYGKKTIILLDEYDTPMQEAYVNGYWEELVSFTRSLFNSTFKTNPYIERGLMIGILLKPELDAPSPLGSKKPRQADEVGFPAKLEKTSLSSQCQSIFSDLNNLEVVTSTSVKYMEVFGFTEAEVFAVLDEYGIPEQKENIKHWYDGFTFGNRRDIYNPWSVINFLDKRKFAPYWANTSSNSLAGKLIREGNSDIKITMEDLLKGGSLCTEIDEQIVFNQLDQNQSAIWSFLLASGYLKVEKYSVDKVTEHPVYELKLTNREVKFMFEGMIQNWFSNYTSYYNDFIKALLLNDVDAMNEYMNRVAFYTFSFFDSGKRPSEFIEPERFYHGFVLGLMVDLAGRYEITSNRESGFGRYDIALNPQKPEDDAYIIEFKVHNPRKEKTLEETLQAALKQIEDKKYETALIHQGIPADKIRKYGFAFQGKTVLIG